ncbi:hypothetical protein EF879_14835 [Micromonospora sp. HM5-17]|jgi:hypothetical protein|nr:hypothetical protein EF879_14835 [Micromonospora sp. HM5-17]
MVVLSWLLLPLLGAAICWLVQWSAGWVASLRHVPWRWFFRMIDSVDEPWAGLGALLLGALAGLLLAGIAADARLTVTVDDDRVVLVRGNTTQEFRRERVAGVFRAGKQLVLLDTEGGELARETSDLPADRLRAAFAAHGYPWHVDGDPYRDEWRRWVEDAAGLPAGAGPLLRARQRAVEKGDRRDMAELRTELARLGVVVRDERKRQYWRPTRPTGG